VEYEKPDPNLQTELFAKFPRDFGDPLRDLFGPLMEPEVRFALLSMQPDFPIHVPKCYFADYDPATLSGLLITERIPYGKGNIEPHQDKCLDFELKDPLERYMAMSKALARLAGHDQAGKFGPDIKSKFPFNADEIDAGNRIPYTPEQLQGKLDKLLSFAESAPQLFEEQVRDKAFLARFTAEAPLLLKHELAIRSFINKDPRYIALCHWNGNIDNAWFWRNPDGALEVGLLDWGSVGQLNVAQSVYGMTCAAETKFLAAHEDDLIRAFLAEYERSGGPRLDRAEFQQHYNLCVALAGIAWILDAPTLVEQEIPDAVTLTGRHDPKLRNNFLARAQLQLLMVLLDIWRRNDIGASLRRFEA
ncbi:MAG: hypothetical protein ABWZ40_09715, partial [Caulobacterales bacterium]